MRLSNRSLGAATLLVCAAFPLVSLGCARDGASSGKSESTGTAQAALSGTVVVPWGGAEGLSFHPGGDESMTRGPSAVAFTPEGGVLVLDSLASRIVRVTQSGAVELWSDSVAKDADTFAVSPQGEVAVHRALALQVDVYGRKGQRSGSVPVPEGAREANVVHLLSQGRVMLEHPFQKRVLLGSPNVPRQGETVLASGREGVAADFGRVGHQVIVRHPDGRTESDDPTVTRLGATPARVGSHAYLVERSPDGEPQAGAYRYTSKTVLDLGEASSGRIVAAKGDQLCTVLEHVDMSATRVEVARELVCVAVSSGAATEKARVPIETSKLYSPRTEFTFDGKRVLQALPTEQGLALRMISLAEVSK